MNNIIEKLGSALSETSAPNAEVEHNIAILEGKTRHEGELAFRSSYSRYGATPELWKFVREKLNEVKPKVISPAVLKELTSLQADYQRIFDELGRFASKSAEVLHRE